MIFLFLLQQARFVQRHFLATFISLFVSQRTSISNFLGVCQQQLTCTSNKTLYDQAGTAKDMDRQLPIFSFFGWPLFVKGFCMAKVLGIYGTTRCQMKDMDIFFPKVPHNPVLAKRFGYSDSMKQGSFQRFFSLLFSIKIIIQHFFCLNLRSIMLKP